MKKVAILIYAKETLIPNYSNIATQGVEIVANNLNANISHLFDNVIHIGPRPRKAQVINTLIRASEYLSDGGLLFLYFHGHGDSKPGVRENDEINDEVIVCYDGFILDDELDDILRRFLPNCQVLSVFDCCSSHTIIEWKYSQRIKYPQILHVASSRDNDVAIADTAGGILSTEIVNMTYSYGYSNYSYLTFCQELKKRLGNQRVFFRKNNTCTRSFLNKILFT